MILDRYLLLLSPMHCIRKISTRLCSLLDIKSLRNLIKSYYRTGLCPDFFYFVAESSNGPSHLLWSYLLLMNRCSIALWGSSIRTRRRHWMDSNNDCNVARENGRKRWQQKRHSLGPHSPQVFAGAAVADHYQCSAERQGKSRLMEFILYSLPASQLVVAGESS